MREFTWKGTVIVQCLMVFWNYILWSLSSNRCYAFSVFLFFACFHKKVLAHYNHNIVILHVIDKSIFFLILKLQCYFVSMWVPFFTFFFPLFLVTVLFGLKSSSLLLYFSVFLFLLTFYILMQQIMAVGKYLRL